MGKKIWAAALLGAAAAGAAYAGRKISRIVKDAEESVNSAKGSHKAFVKKREQKIVLPEGDSFTGGAVGAALGSLEYDMSRAEIQDGAQLQVEACLGSVKVTVPPYVQVVVDDRESSMTDTRVELSESSPQAPVLRVCAKGTLSGVRISAPCSQEEGDWEEDICWEGSCPPIEVQDLHIENAESSESAQGTTAVGLLEHDVRCCGAEAVVASAGRVEESAPEEEDEAAEEPEMAAEEAAEDPV